MKKAGASNTKLLHKEEQPGDQGRMPLLQLAHRASQLPHSAKTLSAKSLESAKLIQSAPVESLASQKDSRMRSATTVMERGASSIKRAPTASTHTKPPLPSSGRSRPLTSKSGLSGYSVTIVDDPAEQDFEEEDHELREPYRLRRRISWAFEHPMVPKTKEISLSETKALLRSQMRMKAESVVPPDFIYLTVNTIQNSLKPCEVNSNTEQNMLDNKKVQINRLLRQNRPSSSPSKIDPRRKVPVEAMDLSFFRDKQPEEDVESVISEVKSVKSTKSRDEIPKTTDREIYSTKCQVKSIKTSPKLSVHPKHIRTTLPKGRVIRPISASVTRKEPPEPVEPSRPITAPHLRVRPDTASSLPSNIAASMPGVQAQRRKHQHVSTAGTEATMVPMLMYPPDMKNKLATILREKRLQRHEDLIESASEIGLGKVSQFNDPMRSHVKFELRTHVQEQEFRERTELLHQERLKQDELMLERKKRHMWTAKAKGRNIRSAPTGGGEGDGM